MTVKRKIGMIYPSSWTCGASGIGRWCRTAMGTQLLIDTDVLIDYLRAHALT